MVDDQTSISLDLPPTLLTRLDQACLKEFGEPGKRSLKLRTLVREYCERQGV
jgi:metal-responsive CopG/Arc/MetJ family transcriptional regulator